jgi:hypothetical protein
MPAAARRGVDPSGGAGPSAGADLGAHGAASDPLAAARAEVERLVAGGVARGEAARAVAARSGIPRRALYGAVAAAAALPDASASPEAAAPEPGAAPGAPD